MLLSGLRLPYHSRAVPDLPAFRSTSGKWITPARPQAAGARPSPCAHFVLSLWLDPHGASMTPLSADMPTISDHVIAHNSKRRSWRHAGRARSLCIRPPVVRIHSSSSRADKNRGRPKTTHPLGPGAKFVAHFLRNKGGAPNEDGDLEISPRKASIRRRVARRCLHPPRCRECASAPKLVRGVCRLACNPCVR